MGPDPRDSLTKHSLHLKKHDGSEDEEAEKAAAIKRNNIGVTFFPVLDGEDITQIAGMYYKNAKLTCTELDKTEGITLEDLDKEAVFKQCMFDIVPEEMNAVPSAMLPPLVDSVEVPGVGAPFDSDASTEVGNNLSSDSDFDGASPNKLRGKLEGKA